MYTARTAAFPVMPSHSHSRDGRHSRTAGQISWAQERTRKKTPYSVESLKCSKTTAKWIAAAAADSDERAARRYGLVVADTTWVFSFARTGGLIVRMPTVLEAGAGRAS
jgi:hypothetical protein